MQSQELSVWRSLVPRHSTPDLCVNDHIHQEIHRQVKRDLEEQIGLGRDLRTRLRGPARKTPKGCIRGPDEEFGYCSIRPLGLPVEERCHSDAQWSG